MGVRQINGILENAKHLLKAYATNRLRHKGVKRREKSIQETEKEYHIFKKVLQMLAVTTSISKSSKKIGYFNK